MRIEPIETARLRLRGFTPADALFAIGIAEKLGCHIAAQRPCEKSGRKLIEYRYEADL